MSGEDTSVPKECMPNQNQKMEIEFVDDQSKEFLTISSGSEPINSPVKDPKIVNVLCCGNEKEITQNNPHSPDSKDSQNQNSERGEENQTLKPESSESIIEELRTPFQDLLSKPKHIQVESISELTSFIEKISTNIEIDMPKSIKCEFIKSLIGKILVKMHKNTSIIKRDKQLNQEVEDQIKLISSKSISQDFTRLCNKLMTDLDFEYRKRRGRKTFNHKKIKEAYFKGAELDNVLQNLFREDSKKAINYFLERKDLFMAMFQLGVVEEVLKKLNSKTATEFRTDIKDKITRALLENPSKIPIDQLEFFLRKVSTIDCSQNAFNLPEYLLEVKGFLIIFLEECEKNDIGLEEYVLKTYKRQLRRLIRYVENRIEGLVILIIQVTEPSIVSPLKLIA